MKKVLKILFGVLLWGLSTVAVGEAMIKRFPIESVDLPDPRLETLEMWGAIYVKGLVSKLENRLHILTLQRSIVSISAQTSSGPFSQVAGTYAYDIFNEGGSFGAMVSVT